MVSIPLLVIPHGQLIKWKCLCIFSIPYNQHPQTKVNHPRTTAVEGCFVDIDSAMLLSKRECLGPYPKISHHYKPFNNTQLEIIIITIHTGMYKHIGTGQYIVWNQFNGCLSGLINSHSLHEENNNIQISCSCQTVASYAFSKVCI